MAAAVETGMVKGLMRKLLNASKKEPVGCAVGIGDNAAYGLMILHKVRTGRAVEKMLKDEFPKAKTTRFGTASVDAEDNPKLVRLQLNRAAPGIAKKLIKTLKGTGFNKVVIVSDDGITEEHEEEDEEAQVAEEEGDASEAESTAEPVAAAPPPEAAPGEIPPAPPPPTPGESPEVKAAQLAALTKALAGLMAAIPAAAGTDAARKATLVKLATDANVNLKTGNLQYAGAFLAQLKKALETPAQAAPAAAEAGKLQKVKVDWTGVRQQVADDVASLEAALGSTYAGAPFADDMMKRFKAKVDPMLARFDDRLGIAIDEVEAAADAEGRAASVATAKGVVKDYLSFAMTDPLITDLDANPFVPLSIRGKTTTALAAVAKAIATA